MPNFVLPEVAQIGIFPESRPYLCLEGRGAGLVGRCSGQSPIHTSISRNARTRPRVYCQPGGIEARSILSKGLKREIPG